MKKMKLNRAMQRAFADVFENALDNMNFSVETEQKLVEAISEEIAAYNNAEKAGGWDNWFKNVWENEDE